MTFPDTLAPPAPDLAALKARQQLTWSAGNYSIVGSTLQIVGETLCEAVDLGAGERVLDVASGNGNAALAAARRYAEVTATDYVPALLENGRARAVADGLAIEFMVADAEDLPLPRDAFDVVLSTFGVMFVADHGRAVSELLRVTRTGGRIGLACWTPEGFIGQLFKTIGRHIPPLAGARSPALWGTPSWIEAEFGPHASAMSTTSRIYTFRYRSPEHWVEVFRGWYGPVLKAFDALDPPGQEALRQDILDLIDRFNTTRDGRVSIPGEYLESVIHRA